MPHCIISKHLSPSNNFPGLKCPDHANEICYAHLGAHITRQIIYSEQVTCMQCGRVLGEDEIKAVVTPEKYKDYLDVRDKLMSVEEKAAKAVRLARTLEIAEKIVLAHDLKKESEYEVVEMEEGEEQWEVIEEL